MSFDINEALAATAPAPTPQRRRRDHPTGFEWEWNGCEGFIQTGPLKDRPRTWDEFIRDAGLDPDEVEVIEPVHVKGWDVTQVEIIDGDKRSETVRFHGYRLNVQRRGVRLDIAELVKAAKRKATALPPASVSDQAFVIALGDLQLGKVDGDGVEGTVGRFLSTTGAAIKRYRRIAKGAPIYLIHLGDCVEGFMSQGGANAWRTSLTTTEQVRLYRRLLVEQVRALAAVAPRLVVAGIPGNHDEAHRPLHTYGDSWAIDAVSAVRDALDLAGNYDHVTMHTPARDELTLTLDICGTVVAMAHGHQFGTGAEGWKNWLKGQAYGRQSVGDADVLLGAHRHFLKIQEDGGNPRPDGTIPVRTFIQVPALESGSQWWKHKTGEWGNPGIVTALMGGGSWSQLEVLR